MTPKEALKPIEDRINANLEEILSRAKDVTSYLDNINDTVSEILDHIKDYDCNNRPYALEVYGVKDEDQ
jgi:hypothetical protein